MDRKEDWQEVAELVFSTLRLLNLQDPQQKKLEEPLRGILALSYQKINEYPKPIDPRPKCRTEELIS
jgi:hypothetical protein